MAAIAGALAAQCAVPILAEDVVTLRAEGGSAAPRKLTGEIVDYTGRELRIRSSTGRERALKPEQIERIETARSGQQSAADDLFAAGEFRQAEAKYRAALEGNHEKRRWMRRQILAQLVWCYQSTGQWEQAGETFLTLTGDDPDTQYFDCIPLAWLAAQPSAALGAKARSWLASESNAAAMLLGASHLLATGERAAAVARLRQLLQSRDARIAWLAQTQLWRIDAVSATQADLARWSQFVESGEDGLRAGPCYVLGSALAARDARAAAMTLVEVPILYPRNRALASASLLRAGSCLEKANRPDQAAALYRELIDRYRDAAETEEARRRLDRVARQSPG